MDVRLPDTLPETMSNAEIAIRDNGTGMTEDEVRSIYLQIANDRRSRSKDARTAGKQRPVKGRKGIGKFAGLAAAHTMMVESTARGGTTRLLVERSRLLEAHAGSDLESIDLPIESTDAGSEPSGTTVTLADLDQSKSLPNPDTLRKLLAREYARANEFAISINGEPLHIADLGGETKTQTFDHPDIGRVTISWTVAEKPLPRTESGFVYRIASKIVGRPTFCGIENEEEIPDKVRNRPSRCKLRVARRRGWRSAVSAAAS